MVLGLYDIDLLHNQSKFPNLELMKIYNYHQQHNDKVILMNQKSDEGRFTEIIYFKEVPTYQVPKAVSLSGSKKHIYGYGFYKKYVPINQKYHDMPPLHIIYSPYADKLKTYYSLLDRGQSIVRCENEDYSGLKHEGYTLMVVDYDFINLPNAKDFVRKFQRYKLIFRTSFHVYDEATYLNFQAYKHILDNSFYIEFPYTYDFFKENADKYTNFHLDKPFEKEDRTHYLNRLVRTALHYKINNLRMPHSKKGTNTFEGCILNWGYNPTSAAYSEFFKNNKAAIGFVEGLPSELRQLLKFAPYKISSEIVDLKSFL